MFVSATNIPKEVYRRPGKDWFLLRNPSSERWVVFCTACILFLATACTPRTAPFGSERSPYTADTSLRLSELNEHLLFFNSEDAEGRATGTRGFARAAVYASRRLASYGLQPIVSGEFGSFYTTPLNFPRSANMRRFTADTLQLRSGVALMADGRSESDSLQFSTVVWDPDPSADVADKVVAIPGDMATRESLRRWTEKGVRAVLIRGALDIQPLGKPVPGLSAARVHPEAFEFLIPAGRLQSGIERYLPFTVDLRISTEYASSASAMNIVGMVPGADPILRNELVVVFVRLDGFGMASDLQLTDGSDLAIGATALLESARMLAELQRWSHPLKRTILIALVSGSFQDSAGLKALLRHPPWPAEHIKLFVEVRDATEDRSLSRRLISESGYAYRQIDVPRFGAIGDLRSRADLFNSSLRRDAITASGRLARNIVETVLQESTYR